jgi:hypothetical protein
MSAPNSPGWFDERERQQISGDGDHRTGGVGIFGEAGVIVDRAGRVGILNQRAKNFFGELKILMAADGDLDFQSLGAGADDFDGLRMTSFGNEKNVPAIFEPVRHGHGFSSGGGLVEH